MKKSSFIFFVKLLISGFTILPTSLYAFDDESTALLSLTSNYYWRGYSKSDNHASIQFNYDFSLARLSKGPYAGFWLSSISPAEIDPESNASAEFIAYGGWSFGTWKGFSSSLQLSFYAFDKQILGSKTYPELYWFLNYRDLVNFELAYSNDAYGTGENSINSQINLRYPLSSHLDVTYGAGYFKANRVFDEDYIYWNAGCTWRRRRYAIDLRYIGDQEKIFNPAEITDGADEGLNNQLVLTLSYAF